MELPNNRSPGGAGALLRHTALAEHHGVPGASQGASSVRGALWGAGSVRQVLQGARSIHGAYKMLQGGALVASAECARHHRAGEQTWL